jgi:hypothetical protein
MAKVPKRGATSSKGRFDPSKIKGPYSLMAALLLALEVVLGYWIHAAQSSAERITAGILMTLVFTGVMIVIVMLGDRTERGVRLPGLAEVKPAIREAEPVEAENPEPDTVAAPDRSYILRRPEGGWTISELTLSEYVAVNLDVPEEALRPELRLAAGTPPDILMFRSPTRGTMITPIPGITRVDGRIHPTALQIPIPTALSVLPLDRAQPPLFIERPFEHNFYVVVAQFLTQGLTTLRRTESGKVGSTGRRFLSAEFRQDIEEAIIDGTQHSKTSVNVSLIGIEGETRDHLLVSRYATVTPSTSQFDDDLRTLRQLIDSFRPIKLTNPAAAIKKMREKADSSHKNYINQNGKAMFDAEFYGYALRVKSLNFDDASDRLRLISGLKPFQIFAEAIGVDDFDELWTALETAENGDASELKLLMLDLIDSLETPEDSPPPPPLPAIPPIPEAN